MNLPNAVKALVEQDKIIAYLLNAGHPDNSGKALFFRSLGFTTEEWSLMASALRRLAATAEVTKNVESPHGVKYILDGRIEAPSGEMTRIRTIWIIDRGQDIPRLVTAYPYRD